LAYALQSQRDHSFSLAIISKQAETSNNINQFHHEGHEELEGGTPLKAIV